MNTKIAYYLLCIGLFVILFTGCIAGNESAYFKHFVIGYYKTVGIEIEADKRIYIRVDGYVNRYNGKDEYEALSVKHGDTEYNRWLYKHTTHPLYSDVDFVNISITSDVDWDEQHPAGTDLGDVVMFNSCSPVKYIRSGYEDEYLGQNGRLSANHPISKLVSELLPDDLILIGNGYENLGYLDFISSHYIAPTYNITVTLTADDGRTFSDTIEVRWASE